MRHIDPDIVFRSIKIKIENILVALSSVVFQSVRKLTVFYTCILKERLKQEVHLIYIASGSLIVCLAIAIVLTCERSLALIEILSVGAQDLCILNFEQLGVIVYFDLALTFG